MPKLMVPIAETDDMVTRPVILDVTRQLMKATRLPEDASIFFPGAEERMYLNGSTINKEGKDVAKFPHTNQISITANEQILEDSVLTRAVLCPEHIPVVIDQVLGILIKPVYAHTTVELSFSNRFTDKALAKRWLNEMRNKISMSRDTLLHKATYSYTIPIAYMNLLREIHRLREKQGGYDQDFDTWFNLIKSPHVTEITNVGGKVVRTGVRETQQRIIGQFDFKEEPERGGREGDADTWTISFTYKFEYDKVSACVMEYPLVIHNQMLSKKWRPDRDDKPTPQLNDVQQQFPTSLYYINQFEADKEYDRWKKTQKGISIPDFDEFKPDTIPEGTWRIATWLVGLKENDLVDLINIKELPGTKGFDPVLHQWLLESEAPYILEPTKSVFQLQLYQNTEMVPPRYLRIDSQYNTKCKENLNIRKIYHVRFGVYWNWRLLDQDAIDRLRQRPDVVDRLICSLFPHYCGLDYDKILDKLIGRDEMNRIIDKINGKDYLNEISMKTVQSLFIEVDRHGVPFTEEDLYNFKN